MCIILKTRNVKIKYKDHTFLEHTSDMSLRYMYIMCNLTLEIIKLIPTLAVTYLWNQNGRIIEIQILYLVFV